MHSSKVTWNILLADDDQDEYQLLADALSKTSVNHVLTYVDSGEKVLEAVKQIRPDVIFLDINMPGCDGRDCLALIKHDKEVSHIPVVVYSTSNAGPWIEECFELGANHYFIKPSRFGAIVEGLERLFAKNEEAFYQKPTREEFVIAEE